MSNTLGLFYSRNFHRAPAACVLSGLISGPHGLKLPCLLVKRSQQVSLLFCHGCLKIVLLSEAFRLTPNVFKVLYLLLFQQRPHKHHAKNVRHFILCL